MEFENLPFSVGEMPCKLTVLSRQFHLSRSYNRHRHAFLELHYVTNGSCVFRVGSAQYIVEKGQLLCIAAGVYHSVKSATADISKMSLGVELEHPLTKCSESAALFEVFHSFEGLCVNAARQESFLLWLRQLPQDALRRFLVREEVKATLTLLLLRLSEAIPRRSAAVAVVTSETGYSQVIEEFFNLNYFLRDGEVVLAQRLCVSCRQLNRIMHAQYGKRYRDKLKEIRLEIATDLLQTTTKSMGEIAELLGYGSAANFTSFVKNATGKTPTDIRRKK